MPLFPGIFAFDSRGNRAREPDGSKVELFPITYCSPDNDYIIGLDLNDDVEVRRRPAAGLRRCRGVEGTWSPVGLRGRGHPWSV